jgi:hypothetical protein
MNAVELFENELKQIEENYGSYMFFNERDIIWTLQKKIWKQIRELQLPYRVFHEYPFNEGYGTPAVDLAILDIYDMYPMEVAIELKYEPDHKRQGKDIRPNKYAKDGSNTVFWKNEGSVERDVERAKYLLDIGQAKVVYAILIDEGGFHHTTKDRPPRIREPFDDCEWRQWNPQNAPISPWIHWFKRSK